MKPGRIPLLAVVLVVGTTVFVHFKITDATAHRAMETAKVDAQTAELARQVEAVGREAAAARQKLAAMQASAAIALTVNKPAASTPAPGEAKMLALAKDPELRRLHVQAFVNQRRLAFAGFLKKSGAPPETQSRFDAINANYQQGLLDSALMAAAQEWRPNDSRLSALRSQLTADRNAQCEALFADDREGWVAASRTLGAREVVNQIIQQNVQGAGGYGEFLADQLTQMLAKNRLDPAAAATTTDPTGYDWDAALKSAASILSPAQLDGFRTSVTYYQAQARMNSFGGR
jgi:hypothetical protein